MVQHRHTSLLGLLLVSAVAHAIVLMDSLDGALYAAALRLPERSPLSLCPGRQLDVLWGERIAQWLGAVPPRAPPCNDAAPLDSKTYRGAARSAQPHTRARRVVGRRRAAASRCGRASKLLARRCHQSSLDPSFATYNLLQQALDSESAPCVICGLSLSVCRFQHPTRGAHVRSFEQAA